ncbi:hypothetical protein MBRA1_001464 [Malassezia brasiliensis]|uniref:EVE domain-containing protein n=1 Tax=Malassezia brasiliensis TaxID=1821822 RepID=A0AAF0DRP9_9BASI|nr:hypothetical protein MBRA1_001464 [Malassezia brasiliensis]
MPSYWLLKAEPEERRVNGVDVSFSAAAFERVRTSPWEGVRNYQARNFLRDDMKVGHPVLFYHSNTKLPGVAALAEVCREGYPDPTAWEAGHPYYDPHTRPDDPRWYRVDVQFVRRLPHFVPLSLLQHLAEGLSEAERADVAYLTDAHLASVAAMPLLHRSRLSVQPVDATAYEAICLLGDRGGFSAWPGKWNAQGAAKARRAAAPRGAAERDAPRGAAERDAPPRATRKRSASPSAAADGATSEAGERRTRRAPRAAGQRSEPPAPRAPRAARRTPPPRAGSRGRRAP